MRYFKTTFLWIIILAAVGGYTFIDLKSTKIAEQKKEEDTRLLPFTADQVLAISIRKEAGNMDLERWEKGWKIVSPINTMAKNEAVEKFLNEVTASRNDSEYVMDTNPTPERLAEFGLTNPPVRVTLKVGKELKGHTILFGNRAPTMGVAYVQLEGRKPVYRVLADTRSEADKDVYYFRDKSVLKLNPVMVDQVSIGRPGSSMLFKMNDSGHWNIEKPEKARADQKKLFELMGRFANGEVKEFIAEKKENLASYGLDKPATTLMFWLSGDSSPTIKINIGNRSPAKRGYFCSMSDRENIFLIEEKIVDSIPRIVDEMRSREMWLFDNSKLKRLEVRNGGKSVVLVKDAENEWRKGNIKGGKADFNMVNDFLEELKTFDIKEFVSGDLRNLRQYGLDPAQMQVQFWTEDSAVPITLNIGKTNPAGYVYAFTTSEKSVLALEERIIRVVETYLKDL